ncbi:armadillo-type protein [Dichotomocladium elegans]|nr:armadillo-type protein [Dichotomocladium elegans]
MEMNDQAYNALQQYLQQTFDPSTQKEAECQLAAVEVQQGFAFLLLKLITDDNISLVLRFAGAVYFKNYIKRRWVPDNEQDNIITPQDRQAIKADIVRLLISVPEKLQLQISDALSIIAAADFPDEWDNLIEQLVSHLSTEDYRTNNGILQIAHSIFKRWRSQFESDSLFSDIKYVLDRFCQPYLQLLEITDKAIRENATNAVALGPLSQSLILLIKIYYDLNCQDFPEFFENNLPQFMEFFKNYLVYNNQLLDNNVCCAEQWNPFNSGSDLAGDLQDDEEAGPLERIKTGICEVLELYTQKYHEDFPQMVEFFPLVMELVSNTGAEPKYDTMVCRALSLLTCMVKNEKTAGFFTSPEVFKQVSERIALKNIAMREVDEELFEDNPIEYIRRDLEGSDTDTRRRAAADLIRGMIDRYEAQTTQIMTQYISYYLEQYNINPQANWKDKNTAIFLLVAIAARTSTIQLGVTQTNNLVDVVDFFSKHVLSDLQTDVNAGKPILKVDAIKYLYTFRSQLTKEQLLTVFPLLVKHLESNNYVVYTYSAIAIERILFIRSGKTMLFSSADIKPYAETLLSQLFRLIEAGQTPQKLSENDYLMRAVMRVIITCRQDMIPYVNVIMGKLTGILAVVSANPSNPRFNHYIFESIGALIRFIGPISEGAVTEFESMLFTPFQNILGQDIQEFTPYVFQLLAQLLEQHKGQELTEAYISLLSPLLNPPLWEQGNIPALVRLLEAYMAKGIQTILAANKLEPILGIFQQKLIHSRHHDQYAMVLFISIIKNVPLEILSRYLPTLVTAVLTRLMSKKKGDRIVRDRFTRNFTLWLCNFFLSEKLGGPDTAIRVFDSMQPGLFGQILPLFVTGDLSTISDPIDFKICAVGIIKLLTQSDIFLQEPYSSQLYSSTFTALLGMLELPPAVSEDGPDELYTFDIQEEGGYQTVFAKLATASPSRDDPTASLPPSNIYLVQQLVSMPAERRARVKALLPEEAAQFLPKYFEKAGVPMSQF